MNKIIKLNWLSKIREKSQINYELILSFDGRIAINKYTFQIYSHSIFTNVADPVKNLYFIIWSQNIVVNKIFFMINK